MPHSLEYPGPEQTLAFVRHYVGNSSIDPLTYISQFTGGQTFGHNDEVRLFWDLAVVDRLQKEYVDFLDAQMNQSVQANTDALVRLVNATTGKPVQAEVNPFVVRDGNILVDNARIRNFQNLAVGMVADVHETLKAFDAANNTIHNLTPKMDKALEMFYTKEDTLMKNNTYADLVAIAKREESEDEEDEEEKQGDEDDIQSGTDSEQDQESSDGMADLLKKDPAAKVKAKLAEWAAALKSNLTHMDDAAKQAEAFTARVRAAEGQ